MRSFFRALDSLGGAVVLSSGCGISGLDFDVVFGVIFGSIRRSRFHRHICDSFHGIAHNGRDGIRNRKVRTVCLHDLQRNGRSAGLDIGNHGHFLIAVSFRPRFIRELDGSSGTDPDRAVPRPTNRAVHIGVVFDHGVNRRLIHCNILSVMRNCISNIADKRMGELLLLVQRELSHCVIVSAQRTLTDRCTSLSAFR